MRRGHTSMEYERLVLPVLDEQGESAWPERFSQRVIAELRAEVGPSRFASQMMLQPTRPSQARLDPARLIRYEDELELTGSAKRPDISIAGQAMTGSCCWWDPAYGRPAAGDGSVIACVFGDESGRYWLHDIEYLTFDPDLLDAVDEATQLCRRALAFATRNMQRAMIVEVNGLGKFLPGLLPPRSARDTIAAEHTRAYEQARQGFTHLGDTRPRACRWPLARSRARLVHTFHRGDAGMVTERTLARRWPGRRQCLHGIATGTLRNPWRIP